MMEYKLVIIVRNDLKISKGKAAAQVAHAAVTCALECKSKKRRIFKRWYEEGQKKVVLKAENLEALMRLKEMADEEKLISALISDAGLTEIPPGTITCLGIGPDHESSIDKITAQLPLY